MPSRSIRLGYNVLLLDSDVIVFDNPYKYLKHPPFKDIVVINQEEGLLAPNGGVLYVQVNQTRPCLLVSDSCRLLLNCCLTAAVNATLLIDKDRPDNTLPFLTKCHLFSAVLKTHSLAISNAVHQSQQPGALLGPSAPFPHHWTCNDFPHIWTA